MERRDILDYDEVSPRERDGETPQSLNLTRARGEEGRPRVVAFAGRRRNLKLFDADGGLDLRSLSLVFNTLATPPTRFVHPNVFHARDKRNRGVWQKRGGRRGRREKVYFTTDLLSRHARILSKRGDSEGRRRPIAFYKRLPLARRSFPSSLYRYAILRKEK